jgi:hypothetical protein
MVPLPACPVVRRRLSALVDVAAFVGIELPAAGGTTLRVNAVREHDNTDDTQTHSSPEARSAGVVESGDDVDGRFCADATALLRVV